MNARNHPCNWNDDRQWQKLEAYHPSAEDETAYESWAAKNEATRQIRFDDWLDNPEGLAWLDGEAERYAPAADYGYSWERQA